MARLIEGILGGFRGSVGSLIGYNFKGGWFVRTKPRFVHNPRTEKQQEHRMLFGDMVRLASRMLPALKLGFRREAEERGMTEGNAFVKINWQRTGGRLTYSELQVARGPLAPVGFEGYELDEEGVMTVRWEKKPTRGRANSDDRVVVLLYNAALGESKLVDRALRREQSVSILIPDGWAMEEVHVYGFVRDSEGRCSGSSYISMSARERSKWSSMEVNSRSISSCSFLALREAEGGSGAVGSRIETGVKEEWNASRIE